MKDIIKNNKDKIILASVFCILLIWMSFFPLAGDDWGWGDSFKNVFFAFQSAIDLWKSYNGRVLGHVLVFLMSSYPIVKIFIMAMTFTALVYIISKLSSRKNNVCWLMGLFLIIGMPLGIYREVFSWMSGFSNFGIPALTMSIYIYINRIIFDKKEFKLVKDRIFKIIICFLLGFLMNLFSEHSALFSVILGIGMIIITFIMQKKHLKYQYSFLIGAIVGCTFMFMSPSYWEIMAREVGTAMEGLSIFGKIIYNIKHSSWFFDICINNVILNIVLSTLFIKNIKSTTNKIYLYNTILISILSFIINPIIFYKNIDLRTIYQIIIVFIFFVTTLINIYILYYKKNNNLYWKVFLLYVLGYIAALPLLAAVGFGPRCFINSYILFSMSAAFMYKEEINSKNKKIRLIITLLCIAVVSFRFFATTINYISVKSRESEIHNIKEGETLILKKLPFWMYVHQSGIPVSPYHEKVFKNYYRIDENVKIVIEG